MWNRTAPFVIVQPESVGGGVSVNMMDNYVGCLLDSVGQLYTITKPITFNNVCQFEIICNLAINYLDIQM